MLDVATADGRKLPSLRALRAQISKESYTTITEAVKAWKLSQWSIGNGNVGRVHRSGGIDGSGPLWRRLFVREQMKFSNVPFDQSMMELQRTLEITEAEAKSLKLALLTVDAARAKGQRDARSAPSALFAI